MTVQHAYISNGINPARVQTVNGFLSDLLGSIARGDAIVKSLGADSTEVVNYVWQKTAGKISVAVNEQGNDAKITVVNGADDRINLLTVLDSGGIEFQQIPSSVVLILSENLYFSFMEEKNGASMIRHVFFIEEENGNIARAFARIVRNSTFN